MRSLSKAQILDIHAYLVERFGGMPGVREESLLDSALEAPFQTYESAPLYPTICERAAKLAHGLIANHPFNDGNKRVGITVMCIYLEVEGLKIQATNDDLINLGLGIAQGSRLSEIQDWINQHTYQ